MPRGTTVNGDPTKLDWYCKRCPDDRNKDKKFRNFGRNVRCFKCNVVKGTCFHSKIPLAPARAPTRSLAARQVGQQKEADKVAKLHLATVVRPAFGEAKGLLPQAIAPTKPSASASASSAPLLEKWPKPKPPKELVEETRMQPRDRLDEAVGLVVRVQGIPGAPRYQLRTPDYALSERSYLSHELTEAYFNPAVDLAAGMSAAPAALAGCTVEVWWLPANAEARGQFWPATLQPPPEEWAPRTGGREGWFSMVYPATELDFGERAPV